jgi:hypothetical protein
MFPLFVKFFELLVKVFKHILKTETSLEGLHDVTRPEGAAIFTRHFRFHCLTLLDA